MQGAFLFIFLGIISEETDKIILDNLGNICYTQTMVNENYSC